MSGTLKRRLFQNLLLAGALALLAGCVEVGPNYVRPPTDAPAAYKEAGATGSKPVQAMPAQWWTIYHDPQLAALVARVSVHNQSLAAAAAHVREAQALLAAARGERMPSVFAGTVKVGRRNENDVGLGISWDVDLWGRIRRNIEMHGAQAQASADDLAAATLSMQAKVVQGYFALREADAVIALLQPVVDANARWLTMVRNQHAQGVAPRTQVSDALARLGSARVALASARISRAQFEHAIAVMLGRPPADFSIAPAPFAVRVPTLPAGLPSALLQRRPDIAAAERRVAAASAQIGVRKAETLPSLDLIAGVGILQGLFGTVNAKAPLYTGGTLQAGVSQARAAYAAAVADYHQTVLDAFREVEDNLVAQNQLAGAAASQLDAAHSARESERIAQDQYREGVLAYRLLVAARTSALDSGRAALELHLQRLDASVNLIMALGGGWEGDASVSGGSRSPSDATATAGKRQAR